MTAAGVTGAGSTKGPPARRGEGLRGVAFAHRGLHGPATPENSLAAFRAAWRLGYGVELDARLSADGEIIVFHDETLARMTGDPRSIAHLTAADLAACRVPSQSTGGEPIPTLRTVLEARRAEAPASPLLIELKDPAGAMRESLARLSPLLDEATGVMSFDHPFMEELRPVMPEVPLGLTVATGTALSHEALEPFAFVALEAPIAGLSMARRARDAGLALFAWTITSPAQADALASAVDGLIFETFTP